MNNLTRQQTMEAVHLKTAIKQVAEAVNRGHHLDRITLVAGAFGLTDYAYILQAHKAFMDSQGCMPSWLRQVEADASFAVIATAKRAGLDATDLEPIAWALNFEALNNYGLLFLRERAAGRYGDAGDNKRRA